MAAGMEGPLSQPPMLPSTSFVLSSPVQLLLQGGALQASCTGTLAASPFSSVVGTKALAEFSAAPGRKEVVLEKSQTLGERV